MSRSPFTINRGTAAPLCLAALAFTLLAGIGFAPQADAATTKPVTVTGLVFADNSFELYVNGRKVASDPVLFTPFNAVSVSFRASYPMTFAFKASDYADPLTGLEYNNTKVGDGGLIARFSNGLVTGSGWRAKTISHGPTDLRTCLADTKTCTVINTAPPRNWTTTSATTAWSVAKLYTVAQVRPHLNGFSTMNWGQAKFIWGDNLVTDNTVLFRKTITRAR